MIFVRVKLSESFAGKGREGWGEGREANVVTGSGRIISDQDGRVQSVLVKRSLLVAPPCFWLSCFKCFPIMPPSGDEGEALLFLRGGFLVFRDALTRYEADS